MPALCRDCTRVFDVDHADRCPSCESKRTVTHPELDALSIVHVDCDAFFATIEKRDDPRLANQPVIVGGRHRGVVMAACYVARRCGIRSAMPMFQALERCPDAVVLPPNREKYSAVGREVRELMREITPLVEPLSIDEAFLDLSECEAGGTASAAQLTAGLIRKIEQEVRITASVGLSYNKFLAKIASDLDKPRGFAVIGRQEAEEFLSEKPVRILPGVGPALEKRLADDGIETIAQIRAVDEPVFSASYGAIGRRLARFARGEDNRKISPVRQTKSISSETTFEHDTGDLEVLATALWPLAESVAARLKSSGFAAGTVVLKLKTSGFRNLTRSHSLVEATQRAPTLFETALQPLARLAGNQRFRLIGIGAANLVSADRADPPDLFGSAEAGYDPRRAIQMARAAVDSENARQ
jgi:DNA polymerase-4